MPMSVEARKAASDRMKAMLAKKRAEKQEPEATVASTEAGINIPPPRSQLKRATVIPQKSDDELENELETTELDDWLKKHHDAMDANYDTLARISHLGSAQEVRDRLKGMGYEFPAGA